MRAAIISVMTGVLLASCSQFNGQRKTEAEGIETATPQPAPRETTGPLNMSFEHKTWAECVFELDKIEVIHGRNLDDLDRNGSVARNQFLVDCLAARNAQITQAIEDDLGRYASKNVTRHPSDMMLNNGKR